MPTAPYDEIADWYETVFLAAQRARGSDDGFADSIGVDQAICELLGAGTGVCVEVGCGTGVYADRVRALGWDPVGIDLSVGMLRHARGRLDVARGDATALPFATASADAVITVMVHTDLPGYAPVLAEIHRVLRPVARLVNAVVDAGFVVQRLSEGGEPVPIVLSMRAARP